MYRGFTYMVLNIHDISTSLVVTGPRWVTKHDDFNQQLYHRDKEVLEVSNKNCSKYLEVVDLSKTTQLESHSP